MNPDAEALAALVRAGNKIEAIKRLRELTGMDLRDAKEAVERIDSVGAAQLLLQRVATAPKAPVLIDADVRVLAQQGKRIEAIRLLRERKRIGLKDAKDALDAAVPPPPLNLRPLWWIAVAIAAVSVYVLIEGS